MPGYDETEGILFSGDAFGCFGALNGGVIDANINTDIYWDEMVRYYSNIVGKYGAPVQKALQKLQALKINAICSTHGPVWTEEIPRVKGLMIESYIEEGNQSIGDHIYGKSITDPCLGWEDSKQLIYDIAEMNAK